MSESDSSAVKKFLTNPLVIIVAIGAAILWATNGFPPFGFPEGEYACTARSGVQKFPISVYHRQGQPMTVIEYRPGEARDISVGMTYTHGQFERHLSLFLGAETYQCSHVG